MNWSYTATIYLAIFALITMILIVRNNDLLSERKKQQFNSIFIITIIATISEWFALFLNGTDPKMRVFHIIARTLDHSLAPMIAMIFCAIITSETRGRKMFLLMIVHMLLQAASGYFGFIYYIDSSNIYHHGSCYWIYVAFYLSCSLYFVYEALKFGMHYQNSNASTLWFILFYMISGVVIGMIRSDVHIAYICLSVDTILLYIYYTEVVEKTDEVSGLLNRKSYESRLENQREDAVILFFDVDDFKRINDSYGHLYGDKALKTIGQVIKEVYGEKGSCYRIGGDEFCVILKKKLDQVDLINTEFMTALAWKRKEDIRLPFVSVGYAKFDHKKTDIESCIKKADIMMYERKYKNKERTKKE